MAVGSQFPEELLANPSFTLYLLEEPDLLTGIGGSALRALLEREVRRPVTTLRAGPRGTPSALARPTRDGGPIPLPFP